MTINSIRKLALSYPASYEEPHFEKTSFRVKKKIFATLAITEKRLVVKLPLEDQITFCSYNQAIIAPVKGAWGKQGWTTIYLDKISTVLAKEVLTVAFKTVAPKTITKQL